MALTADIAIVRSVPKEIAQQRNDWVCINLTNTNSSGDVEYFRKSWEKESERTELGLSNSKYVQFELDITKQYNSLSECFDGVNLAFVKAKMKESLTELLIFKPETIAMELSADRNIFYTLIKNEFTVFVTCVLDPEADTNDDDYIVTPYKDNQRLPMITGSITSIVSELKRFLQAETFLYANNQELEYDELPA
jgi:hypothetical protein